MLTFCAYYSRMLSTFFFNILHMNRDFYVIDVKIIKTDEFFFR